MASAVAGGVRSIEPPARPQTRTDSTRDIERMLDEVRSQLRSERIVRRRDGLIIQVQTRRDKTLFTVLEPDAQAVVALEPWEHQVLTLCDGQRTAQEISQLVRARASASTIQCDEVRTLLHFLLSRGVVDEVGLRPETSAPEYPDLIEWDNRPDSTGAYRRAKEGTPFAMSDAAPVPNLDNETVAFEPEYPEWLYLLPEESETVVVEFMPVDLLANSLLNQTTSADLTTPRAPKKRS